MPEQEVVENDKVDDADRSVQASDEVGEGDNGVTEIESLCMSCYGDVRNRNSTIVVQI